MAGSNMPDHFAFPHMLSELKASGYTQAEIARQCQVSRVTVWRLANNISRDPPYSTGRRIEQLFLHGVSPLKR